MDYEEAVVLDCGSGNVKAGIACEEAPHANFPTMLCYTEHQLPGTELGKKFIGSEAESKMRGLRTHYPIKRGTVTDWSDMEAVWDYAISNRLKLDPKDQPVFLTEPALYEQSEKEKTLQVFFESLQVPAMARANTGMLAVIACGRTSAISFESGEGLCQVVPVYEGNTERKAIRKYNIGGGDLTSQLHKMLTAKGYVVSQKAEMGVVRDMKEKLCYTALDFEQEVAEASKSSALEKSYEMPDGSVVSVAEERFKMAECMFQPALINDEVGAQVLPVHQMIASSLQDCDPDTRDHFHPNILVSGGNTLMSGFVQRLEKELKLALSNSGGVKVIAPPDRLYSAWLGATILTSLSTIAQQWTTKANYEENGPTRCYQHQF